MWFSALKLGLNAATHVYKKKQETKMKMADAQLMHADKMARGEERIPGQIVRSKTIGLERRVRVDRVNAPDSGNCLGVFSDDPGAAAKIKLFFEQFQQLPSWFTNLWILVVASIYGIKGTQIFKGRKKLDD